MTVKVRDNMDFLLGGTFLATAPMFPRVCDIMTTGQLNDGLTILIQCLSVVLILIRIVKATDDEKQDETHT